MTERKPFNLWPLRPATTAYVLDGLASTLSDLIEENGSDITREQLKQLSALGITSSLCAEALAHWFASRPAGDHDLLEGLQERTEGFGER